MLTVAWFLLPQPSPLLSAAGRSRTLSRRPRRRSGKSARTSTKETADGRPVHGSCASRRSDGKEAEAEDLRRSALADVTEDEGTIDWYAAGFGERDFAGFEHVRKRGRPPRPPGGQSRPGAAIAELGDSAQRLGQDDRDAPRRWRSRKRPWRRSSRCGYASASFFAGQAHGSGSRPSRSVYFVTALAAR